VALPGVGAVLRVYPPGCLLKPAIGGVHLEVVDGELGVAERAGTRFVVDPV
jgi:hypothetical protein